MTPKIVPQREVTEIALKMLIWAQDDLYAGHGLGSRRPRIGRSLLGPVSPEHIRKQAIIFRMVSIVEAFLDTLSRELMGEYLPNRTQVLNRLIEDFDNSSTINWQQRHDAYKRYHEIELEKCASWKLVSAAIEARNAVAHGLGRMTPKQAKKAALPALLRNIDISIVNGELSFGSDSLTTVKEAGITFIKAVDAQTT